MANLNRRRICVFCGSSLGRRPEYAQAAAALGTLLAERGLALVYGGANVGLMGIVADACLAVGGEVIGVMPRLLVEKEVAHTGLSKLHVVESMHERKALMAELSDAFIAIPGGFGTLDELCEILTWAQLGLHHKPTGLLNVAGYFAGLIALLDHAVAEQLLKPRHRELLLADDDAGQLLTRCLDAPPVPASSKW
ncbi:MAG: TIGR00730 family Rossman fold protein [Acidobacteria bacterium]|nr:TIGR00730 family Rossman fold protein [Acidobacteriota bacterium]